MEFCYKTAKVWQIVGYAIMIIKIIVPLVLIILGMIDFFKAIMDSDAKAISKTAASLLKKFIIAIVIFFIPTIINVFFNFIGGFSEVQDDYLNCVDCLTSPNDKCDTSHNEGIFTNKDWL